MATASSPFTPSAIGVLNVLSNVLAVRFTLVLAVAGAIGLAFMVLRDPIPFALATLGAYGALVVVPLIWLASRK